MLGVLQRPSGHSATAHATQHVDDPLTLIAQRGRPLVDVSDLQNHLDLLGVFHKLHHAVDPAGVVVDPSTNVPIMSAAQSLFLSRAQHRFDLWATKVLDRPNRQNDGGIQAQELPPVDVLLLWHVYMLNPIAYREDVIRVYPSLARVGAFPWDEIHGRINTSTFEMNGTTAQIRLWETTTAEPFEPRLTTLDGDTLAITCPRCLAHFEVPWMTVEGTGYGEVGFKHTCAGCALVIDSDALSVSKLLNDLATGGPLAHTVLNEKGVENHEYGCVLSGGIHENLGRPGPQDGDRFGWRLINIRKALLQGTEGDKGLHDWLSYVLKAYDHPGKASIDLKAAVLRQGRFIQSMHNIHWAGPGLANLQMEDLLKEAIASYERYFALTKTHTYGLVPTLDVDLAFHTHQLSGPIYADDCFTILGRFLNHDDTESNPDAHRENVLRSVELWNSVYGARNDTYTSKNATQSSHHHGPKGPGGPRGNCSNCDPAPPPPAPPPPGGDTLSVNGISHPPKPGSGGGPHTNCSNCDPKPPPPPPDSDTPPPPSPAEKMHTMRNDSLASGIGGQEPDPKPSDCASSPPGPPPPPCTSAPKPDQPGSDKHRFFLSSAKGGPEPDPKPSDCASSPPGPPPPPCTSAPAPEQPGANRLNTIRGFLLSSGPGSGGGPHTNCSNCDPGVVPRPPQPTKPDSK